MAVIQPNLIAVLLVGVVLIAAALLLRWVRCPGWPLIGGVCAGILLGPGIFGRVAPDQFELIFLGGARQNQRLHELQRDLDVAGSLQTGLSADEVRAMAEAYRPRLEQAQAELDAARRAHGLPLRVIACLAAAIVLLAGTSPRGAAMHLDRPGRDAMISALSIGSWQAALPAAVAFFFCRWWEFDIAESLLAAAAVAIGPWALAAFDIASAEQAEQGGARTIWNAGRAASVIAIGVVIAAIALSGKAERSWPLVVLFALPLGWCWRALTAKSDQSVSDRSSGAADGDGAGRCSALRVISDFAAIPIVAAAAMIGIEIFADFDAWLLVVMLIVSGDGRWLGAIVGAMVPGGRPMLRTMRLVLGSIAAGPTQIVVTMLAVQAGLISGEIALALVGGAVLIELAAPLRRSMARRLAAVEEQLPG